MSRMRFSLGTMGVVLVGVGFVMATMPFVGPLMGMPVDGGEVLAIDRNRLLLHVIPGVVGALLGLLLVHGHRACTRQGTPYPRWLTRVTLGAVALGMWNGLGPWFLDLVLPAESETGLMFRNIPHFESYSALHQLAVEAVCHAIPGLAATLAAMVAYGAVQPAARRGRYALQPRS